eukprot:scaffold1403_cov241-Pinguiococcus_pyrenoidosus.AAC.10
MRQIALTSRHDPSLGHRVICVPLQRAVTPSTVLSDLRCRIPSRCRRLAASGPIKGSRLAPPRPLRFGLALPLASAADVQDAAVGSEHLGGNA